MNRKDDFRRPRRGEVSPGAIREMRDAARDLSLLYLAACRAVRRNLRAGQTGAAARLAADARFLGKLIAAIRAEAGLRLRPAFG